MNTKQQNKLNMYLAVQAVCETNEEAWSSLAAFGTTFREFETRVETIRGLALKQAEVTTGIAANKQRCREEMCDLGAEVAGAVRACALKDSNLELAGKVNFSRSDLLVGRDSASADRCQNIHAAATDNLASLGNYGVTTAKLEALQQKIDSFLTCIHKPREAIALNKSATKQLSAEFSAADKLLRDGLDPLVLQFKASAANFYADYTNARVIVDATATRESGGSTPPQAKAA